eukprot:NODE_941_length_2903_cov_0.299572.p1 type:complete len:200 gc:universal NODE_941_length_2903_cov_0.299572:2706-2107(-)
MTKLILILCLVMASPHMREEKNITNTDGKLNHTYASMSISNDNLRCGTYFNSSKCSKGNCCSSFGWCGNSKEHCDTYHDSQFTIGLRGATNHLVVSDCELVIKLAIGLHLDIVNPDKFKKVYSNCCNTPDVGLGTICKSGRVVSIDWRELSLNGTIKTEFIPPMLKYLSLYGNNITGPIPENFPASLKYLYVANSTLKY